MTAPIRVVPKNALLTISDLFGAAAVGGTGILKYRFWDSGVDAASGNFVVAGQVQRPQTLIEIDAGQLGQTGFQTGAASTDIVWIQTFDGIAWTDWASVTATVLVVNRPPSVSAADRTLSKGQSVAAGSLFTASDPDGDPLTYELWQDAGTGGQFTLNGAAEPKGRSILLNQAQLDQTTFQWTGGVAASLWVRVSDGSDWSAWQGFNVTPTAAAHAADWHF